MPALDWTTLASEVREQGGSSHPIDVANRAVEKEIPLTWQDLIDLDESRIASHGLRLLPPYVYDFIGRYAKERAVQHVVDPQARTGVLLTSIADIANAEGTGVLRDSQFSALANAINQESRITWTEHGEAIDGTFDLLVSIPRLTKKARPLTLELEGESIDIRESEGLLSVLHALTLLKEGGEAIFATTDRFFRRQSGLFQNIDGRSLDIHSVVALPPGALVGSSVPINLAMVGKTPVEDLFVARLSSEGQVEPILANLIERRSASKRELGCLVAKDEFVSWEALQLEDEIEQLARRSGMKAAPLRDIVEEIDTTRDEDGFDDLAWRDREAAEGEAVDTPNRVFVPRFGGGPVVTQVADLNAAHKRYLCLHLDPGRVYADFMAQLLNTDFGAKIRARWAGGRVQKALPGRDRLMGCIVYLPAIEQQEAVIEAQQHIDDLRLQLNELEGRLWIRPVQGEEIGREIDRLNRDEGLDTWIESLPFPIASILRRYHAQADLRAQQDLIIDFFEALTEFVATIMLSAMRQDEARFDERKAYWLGDDEQYQDALTESSFGTWRNIAERLAKDTRRMLSGDERAACIELYRAPSLNWLEAISDKSLFGVLDTMNEYRNRWRHGATPGRRELERRLQMLTKELSAARGIIEHAFEDVDLLMPLDARYRDGVYMYTAKQLVGSNQIFEEATVETTTPMEDDRLHLLDTKSDRPLELLPFFTMMPSPSTQHDTCYFYNRLEGGEDVRWLTYHTETNHEETVPSPEVANLLRDIMRRDEGTS